MLTNQEGTWFNHQETLFHSHDAREDPDSNALKGIDWDLEGELVLPNSTVYTVYHTLYTLIVLNINIHIQYVYKMDQHSKRCIFVSVQGRGEQYLISDVPFFKKYLYVAFHIKKFSLVLPGLKQLPV